MHIFHPMLPICSAENSLKHANLALVPLLGIAQFTFGAMVTNSTMFYLHFMPVFITQGIVVLKEIK